MVGNVVLDVLWQRATAVVELGVEFVFSDQFSVDFL